MTLYNVIMVPPEGQPQTFDDLDANGETIQRPMLRHITMDVGSEDAAKRLAEQQAFDIATQEVASSGEFSDNPDGAMDATLEKQWVVKSIEEVPAAVL